MLARFSSNRILTGVAQRWDAGDRPALTAAVARAEVAGRALGRLSDDRWPLDLALQLRGIVNRGDAAAGRASCIPALLDAVKLQSADQWSEAEVRLTTPHRVALQSRRHCAPQLRSSGCATRRARLSQRRTAASTRRSSVEKLVHMSISACRVGPFDLEALLLARRRNTSKRSIGNRCRRRASPRP